MPEPHKNNPYRNNLPTEDSHPSVRALSYRMHCAHDSMFERLSWLSRRLEAQGLEDLAHHCAVWSREHATAAAVLRKRAR